MPNYYSSGNMKKALIIAIAIVVLGVLFFFNKRFDRTSRPLSPEEIIKKQMEELDKLREQAAANPLTEEEKKKQMEELDKLRAENQEKPLSQEEINKQIEELNKLRSQQ